MFFPLLGYAPDADPTTPGVLVDCDLLIPTLKGFKALPGDSNAGITAGPSAVASMFTMRNLDGTNRILAGTEGSASAKTASLYDVNASGWTNRDGAGGPYTATGSMRWSFATYGEQVLAAQKGTGLLKSTAPSTDFTAVAGAPQASIVISVLDFLMAFNTTEGTYGDSPNRWWCCAAGNIDSWTADVATQATTGLLTDGDGGIVAAGRVGSNVVAFKPHYAYLGQYVGAPQVWSWVRIPGDGIGAWSHHSLVDVEGLGVLWPGRDNFYLFDGTRAVALENDVAETFLADLDISQAQSMVGYHDRSGWRVYWWYPSNSGGAGDGTLDRVVVFNYRSKKWGFGAKTVAYPFEYLEPGITYDDLGSFYATWDDLPVSPYDNAFKTAGTHAPGFVGTNNIIYKMEGEGNNCSYKTGFAGQDGLIMHSKRFRPRFMTKPSTGEMTHLYADNVGDATASVRTAVAARALVDGAFDSVFAARWHQVEHRYTGSMEITGLDVEMEPDSEE
jgi:hypothetical protein